MAPAAPGRNGDPDAHGPETALDRLLEVERRLGRETREAREEAEALVREARERARTLVEAPESAFEEDAREVRGRVEEELERIEATIGEDAERRVEAWRALSPKERRELGRRIAREVVRRQDETLGGRWSEP